MKIRLCHVSNSSSSSFIVLPQKIEYEDYDYEIKKTFRSLNLDHEEWDGIFDDGEHQFGWQVMNYTDFKSKWNWMMLQAYYAYKEGNTEFLDEIRSFMSEMCPDIILNIDGLSGREDDIDVYIDHQSINPDIEFESIESIGISQYLMNENCYVRNSNDNL